MPFATVFAFKKEAVLLLDAYCSYMIYKPKRYSEAKDLLTKLEKKQAKEEVLEAIHNVYCDLLMKGSYDNLVKKLALLLAKELDVAPKNVEAYLNHRRFSLYFMGVKNDGIKKIRAYDTVNMIGVPVDSYIEAADPILAAYENRQKANLELKECKQLSLTA